MKRGPPRAELGIASCPACDHETMRVANNKHGFPCSYCGSCKTQFAPRAEKGSLALMGRIHTWNNPEAASLMLDAGDRDGLAPGASKKPGKLPPHLQRSSSPATPAPKAKPPAPSSTATPATRRSWLDKPIG